MALVEDTANVLGFGFNAASDTRSFTCISGSDRVLYVVTLNRNVGAGTVTGVTYAGVALTQLASTLNFDTGQGDGKLWRLIAPATGANNLVVTLSSDRPTAVSAVSFSGADQTTPEGTLASYTTAGGGTNPTLTSAVAVASGNIHLSFGMVLDGTNSVAPQFTGTGTSQTERTDVNSAAQHLTQSDQAGTGATITASWTYAGAANDSRGAFSIPVLAAAGGASFRGRGLRPRPFAPGLGR